MKNKKTHLRVRIINAPSDLWYKDKLGEVIEVENKVVEWSNKGVPYFQKSNGMFGIACSNCEIIGFAPARMTKDEILEEFNVKVIDDEYTNNSKNRD